MLLFCCYTLCQQKLGRGAKWPCTKKKIRKTDMRTTGSQRSKENRLFVLVWLCCPYPVLSSICTMGRLSNSRSYTIGILPFKKNHQSADENGAAHEHQQQHFIYINEYVRACWMGKNTMDYRSNVHDTWDRYTVYRYWSSHSCCN